MAAKGRRQGVTADAMGPCNFQWTDDKQHAGAPAAMALVDLPVDALLEIVMWCRATELRALAQTCSLLRDILESEAVWRAAYARDWPPCAPSASCLARVDDDALWRKDAPAAAAAAALCLVKRAPDPRCRHHPPSLVRAHGWRWACASNLCAPLYRCCTSGGVPCAWGHDAVADRQQRPMAVVYRSARAAPSTDDCSPSHDIGANERPPGVEAGVAMTMAPAGASWHWGTWTTHCPGDGPGVCVAHTGNAPGLVFAGRLVAGWPRGPGRLWLPNGAAVDATWVTPLPAGVASRPVPTGDGRLITAAGDSVWCTWRGLDVPRVSKVALADGRPLCPSAKWRSVIVAAPSPSASSLPWFGGRGAHLIFWPDGGGGGGARVQDTEDGRLLDDCVRAGRFFDPRVARSHVPAWLLCGAV